MHLWVLQRLRNNQTEWVNGLSCKLIILQVSKPTKTKDGMTLRIITKTFNPTSMATNKCSIRSLKVVNQFKKPNEDWVFLKI
jgi:hypothetical protein